MGPASSQPLRVERALATGPPEPPEKAFELSGAKPAWPPETPLTETETRLGLSGLGGANQAEKAGLKPEEEHPGGYRAEAKNQGQPKPEDDDGGPALEKSGQPTAEEREAIARMRRRDQEVRRHEQAHMAAGAGVVQGGPQYEYQIGPDGKRYAVGGHVNIKAAGGGDPAARITHAEQVRKAALAPANPSAQDRAVAAKASRDAAKARREQQKQAERPNGLFEGPALQAGDKEDGGADSANSAAVSPGFRFSSQPETRRLSSGRRHRHPFQTVA